MALDVTVVATGCLVLAASPPTAAPLPANSRPLTFRGDANGQEAPIRIIQGPKTGIHGVGATAGARSIRTITRSCSRRRRRGTRFKPRAIIEGPVRTGNQFEVYAPNRLLIAHARGNLELWRLPLRGVSTDPPQRIPAPLGRASADTGIALDPVHKEVIIATAAGNTIMTFSVPEIFDTAPATK